MSVLAWPAGVSGCLRGPEPTAPTAPTAKLTWDPHGPTPLCSPLSLRGSESTDLETEAPSLFSPAPLSFLPLSSPPPAPSLPLSLLLPNASWLRLNISPPRFLAPALGAFTKRRASSPLPRLPSLPPPPSGGAPLRGGSGLVQGPGPPSGLGQGGTGLVGMGAGWTGPGSLREQWLG